MHLVEPIEYRSDDLGLPWMRTERLILRFGADADVEPMVRFRVDNREHLAPWEPERNGYFFTEDAWRRRFRLSVQEAEREEAYSFVLFPIEEENRVIGVANLQDVYRHFSQSATLGYSIDRAYQGLGLMTEACRAVIWFAFSVLGLHRVEACYMPTNRASARVLEKLGFVREGLLRQSLLVDGRWEDHVLSAIIDEDWKPQ
ncbi:MAG TPA: GNAT family N-acetyltransferase [Fimbriimonadaceae bacterium]|nr:GNAT family N-acetyltransferase [Fimbriimonadaceae bacterium]HRJ97695.1 GNAT family N-acetyltransferase [Fimbriimonadaceae bacterium]